MMNYHPDLESLKSRFEIFIGKLLAKATELEEEAKLAAQLVYDEDPDRYKRAYGQFKLGIEGQFNSLISKATAIFDEQIHPIRSSTGYSNANTWYSEVSNSLRNFEDVARQKAINVFKDVKEISNEVYLQEILKEYEAIKEAFTCSQCGANLRIDQMYFVSTYITCSYCQTQNTFVPGTIMTQLEGLARDLAEERLQPIKDEYENNRHSILNKEEKLFQYLFYRAYVWLEKSKIVPIYTDSYSRVYLREIHDMLSGMETKKVTLQPEIYHYIVTRLGFAAQLKPQVIEIYENNDDDEVRKLLMDWEQLYALSSVTATYLFQGLEHQTFHDEQFQRIQKEWNIISTINAALVNNEMALKDAINTINLKLK